MHSYYLLLKFKKVRTLKKVLFLYLNRTNKCGKIYNFFNAYFTIKVFVFTESRKHLLITRRILMKISKTKQDDSGVLTTYHFLFLPIGGLNLNK